VFGEHDVAILLHRSVEEPGPGRAEAMRLPRVKLTVRRLMGVVAMVGLALGIADALWVSAVAAKYRRKADSAERLERRCRQIDAMDAETRARAAEAAYDDPYLDNPAWNRRMIPYFEVLKHKYRYAAEHPREPVPPDPPIP
jgi:hypothetical protein